MINSTNTSKFQGIFPAFYACYDSEGKVSPSAAADLARYLLNKGVKGLYVGGSSGECIYQTVEERTIVLESVMSAVGGQLTVIAHVACNNTADSKELARHAESLGVDAIASIPPIYFKLSDTSIEKYWNDISSAAPNTPFIIYNIPQLAGVSLTTNILREMKKNPNVIGVKNSSMAVYDIISFCQQNVIVFNGPDEQLASGLMAGAIGGIGGTYGVMPELYIKIQQLVSNGENDKASELQSKCCEIIQMLCSGKCNLYAMLKEILRIQGGPDCGDVRLPLGQLTSSDKIIAKSCAEKISEAIQTYC